MSEGQKKLIQKLREKKAKAALGGGPRSIEKQHEGGRLSARERISRLVDPSSFQEMNMLAALPADSKKDLYGDGAVVGYGKIDGRKVCIYAQDFTVHAGTTGPIHRSKITGIMDMAVKIGAPLVALWHSGGGRLDSENRPLPVSRSSIFFRCTQASGIVPQVSAMMGPGAGNAGYAMALTDFVLMVDQKSYTFATGPVAVKEVLGEEISMEDLGGARVHSQLSGLADLRVKTEEECFQQIRALLSYFPSNFREKPARIQTGDDPERFDEEIGDLIPTDPRKSYDMKKVIARLLDNGVFWEAKAEFARNIITGFGRLGGYSVGVIANQPLFLAGSLTIDSSDKEARFIRFCDAFNIPLIFLVDTTGFLPGSQQEHGGILRHGAKVLYAIAESVVPKVSVLIRKAYGGAKPAMGIDKDIGIDHVYSWPTGESAIMGAEAVAEVIYGREISTADDPEKFRQEKIQELREAANPYPMVHGELVDDIIEPRETRRRLIATLESLEGKQEIRHPKRHGNIPL
ncbi:MAG: methylmalonyl-CoA carboxyltransferase [Deltaproteobacteria bacterium SM23_61]|nr:MAG: methylmalonyl-CoA carboxyltransferase [Deltaproteobacteria bacterium SM23_61]